LLKLPKQVDPVNTMNIDSDTLCTNKYFQTIKQKILQLLKYSLHLAVQTKNIDMYQDCHKYLMSLSITKKDSCQQDKIHCTAAVDSWRD